MKPRLWHTADKWWCGYKYPFGGIYLNAFTGSTPREAYTAWKFRIMKGIS